MPAPHFLHRLVAAGPDAVTAGAFLTLWIAPLALGESGVRNALLVMLVEFVLIHAAGFLGGLLLNPVMPRGKRVLALAGFTGFYLLFVGAFMLAFREWWPVLVFGWLVLGKFGLIVTGRGASEAQTAVWGMSALIYLLGAFVTILLPLPRLGVGVEVVGQLGLPGSGLWVEQPHRVLAFGFLYFGLLAAFKWHNVALPTRIPPAPHRRRG
ncbi:MAG: hypothetical protein KF823_14765 [Xanthomonadales bacterium]|nr:hypothetical protein [Xanthomonadales bacterium]